MSGCNSQNTDDPKAAGREFSPWLAAYYGTTWPGITALLAGRDGYLHLRDGVAIFP